MPLSDSKQFALEVLDILEELVRPEIKNRFMKQIWYGAEWLHFGGVYRWIKDILIKKPDEEIDAKLLIIKTKLNKKFKDLDTSVEINMIEQLNPGVEIANVGELGKLKNLTKINKEQAKQLLKELGI